MALFTAPKFLQQDLSLITHHESGPIILTARSRWKQVMFFGLTVSCQKSFFSSPVVPNIRTITVGLAMHALGVGREDCNLLKNCC